MLASFRVSNHSSRVLVRKVVSRARVISARFFFAGLLVGDEVFAAYGAAEILPRTTVSMAAMEKYLPSAVR